MKNSKKILALLILFVSVAMFSILPATASVLNEAQKHTTDDNGIQIEAKFKKITSYKITFNCNGGKIGSKKTTVKNIKKGAKIKKFPATPKRTGYTFQGWYTKKSGGKKINKNTKPTKSATVYTHWVKITSASKVVGHWKNSQFDPYYGAIIWYDYYFYANGKFEEYRHKPIILEKTKGKYSVSNGKVYFKERKFYDAYIGDIKDFSKKDWQKNLKYRSYGSRSDMTSTYRVGSDKDGVYLSIAHQNFWSDRSIMSVLEQGTYYEYKYRK